MTFGKVAQQTNAGRKPPVMESLPSQPSWSTACSWTVVDEHRLPPTACEKQESGKPESLRDRADSGSDTAHKQVLL